MIGNKIYELMEELFPICRSITGEGVRETLRILQGVCPLLKTYNVPSGTKVFDWTVPKEWNITDAYVEDSRGKRVIDFKENNLHVVGYSLPMNEYMRLDELKSILHTYPSLPDAIPYVTSYYKNASGFCISSNEYNKLKDDVYHAVIDSKLENGNLTYGEIVIPGMTEKEVLFSTYVCHPSMANNELSGPCTAIYLADELSKNKNKYTYRFVFVPETIGSITYIYKNLDSLKRNVVAGFNLSCLGDDKTYTIVSTRYGNTLADRVAKLCVERVCSEYKLYPFLKRGSDERQYNMPGVDIPVCGLYRTKSNEYDEYHTSADNMSFVKASALDDSFSLLKNIVHALEYNDTYITSCLCEPQLGTRGLYPLESTRGTSKKTGAFKYLDFLAYADGTNDLIDLSKIIGISIEDAHKMAVTLLNEGLINIYEKSE